MPVSSRSTSVSHLGFSLAPGFIAVVVSCAVLGCSKTEQNADKAGNKQQDKQTTNKQQEKPAADGKSPDNGSTSHQSAEAGVYAAMDDAIAKLENKEYRAFIEYYLPPEQLSDMRREGGVEEIVKLFEQNPKIADKLLQDMKRMREVKPTFRASKTIAVFRLKTPSKTVKVENIPLTKENDTGVEVTGYGADLKTAIGKAVSDLEGGNVTAYLKNMLPVADLKLHDPAELADRLTAQPALVKAMIADLKEMQKTEPAFEQNDTVAVFTLSLPEEAKPKPDDRRKRIPPPAPVVKLQKVDGHWRLFDNTSALQKSATGLSRKLLSRTETFIMEKFGDAWRIASRRRRRGLESRPRTGPPSRKFDDFEGTKDNGKNHLKNGRAPFKKDLKKDFKKVPDDNNRKPPPSKNQTDSKTLTFPENK